MPRNIPGMYFDEERGRYFAIPRNGQIPSATSDSIRRLQSKISDFKGTPKSAAETKSETVAEEFNNHIKKLKDQWIATSKELQGNCTDDSKLIKFSTFLSKDKRLAASRATANIFSRASGNPFLPNNEIKLNLIFAETVLPNVRGFYVLDAHNDLGTIFEVSHCDNCNKKHTKRTEFYHNYNEMEFNNEEDDNEPLSMREIANIGVNTSDNILNREEFKKWLSSRGVNQTKQRTWKFGEHELRDVKSDITYIYCDHEIECIGFRDGTVLLSMHNIHNGLSVLNIGSAVCDIKVIFFNGLLVCVVSGIGNVLRSFKFNHITFEWKPFMTYEGYKNKSKLTQNIKVFYGKCVDHPFNLHSVFVVESEDDRLKDRELKFYDFTSPEPLKAPEIRLSDNEFTPILWGITKNKLIVFNRNQRSTLIYVVGVA